jgi:hypothetical protein
MFTAHVQAVQDTSAQPVARISVHAPVSPRQLTAAQLTP